MTAQRTMPPTRVADAPARNWVDAWAPEQAKPFLRLSRFDRPIGGWLLLFPCWWSQALAQHASGHAWLDPRLMVVFLVGAFVMRGAGCTYNDIVDRDYDARVARTASRPIPSGQVGVTAAWIHLAAQCFVGLACLLQLNFFTVSLGASSLLLVAIYPFMKRVFAWPQLVLGLTFKWGALVGWSAVTGGLALPAMVLYVGCIAWTIGYDTIYALQDKHDDRALGLKSTALWFAERTRLWIGGLYGVAWIAWMLAGWLIGARGVFFTLMLAAAAHLVWQVATLDAESAANCLTRFRSNRDLGWLVLIAIAADMAWSAATLAGP